MTIGNISGDHLLQLIQRVERLEEEKANIMEDIRDIMKEAKGSGFDTKVIRQILKIRKMEQDEVAEQEALLELYMEALGMKVASSVDA